MDDFCFFLSNMADKYIVKLINLDIERFNHCVRDKQTAYSSRQADQEAGGMTTPHAPMTKTLKVRQQKHIERLWGYEAGGIRTPLL